MKIYNDAIELKKLAINLVQQENNRQYELDKLKIQSDMKARIYAYKGQLLMISLNNYI